MTIRVLIIQVIYYNNIYSIIYKNEKHKWWPLFKTTSSHNIKYYNLLFILIIINGTQGCLWGWWIILGNTFLKNPVESESEVHCTSNNHYTEVNHKVGLRYGHHHTVLLLEVRIHLNKVQVSKILEKENSKQNCKSIQA